MHEVCFDFPRRGSPMTRLTLFLFPNLVGFTGSGQTMRKDPTRSRHIYQKTDDEGY